MQSLRCGLILITYYTIFSSSEAFEGAVWEDPFQFLVHVRSYTESDIQTTAVQDLVKRVLGDHSNDFELEVNVSMPSAKGLDVVKLTTPQSGKVKIAGTSGVAVAFGLNYYLKYYCRKQMSWAGDNLSNLPSPLPALPPDGLELNAGVKYRYYQNVCTVSYSSVWWNWTRWEREIDWMALNGINLPLAFTGQEAIWKRVYMNLGCTEKDLEDHFAGPAFLAWGRMGNINKWGGPLPASWIEGQLALQHHILPRMRSLGMIPVLPGFAGHVPAALTTLYPTVNVTRLGGWSNFNCTYSCTYLLEPQDPFFNTIGKMFIEEQIKEYNGTNHIYNADTFNEMIPRSSDPDYLSRTSSAVFQAMTASDEKAIWLMQGWLFHNAPDFWKPPQAKALLTAVPQGRMIVLDLFSESYPQFNQMHSYYGQPFIWCMLHDFGGNMGFYGKIEAVNNVGYELPQIAEYKSKLFYLQGPASALMFPNSTMIGTGITPEGINQNYIMYDLMLEIGYFAKATNLTNWITEFAKRRYDSDNSNAISAWLLLGSTIYNDTTPGFPAKRLLRGPICDRPTTNEPDFPKWYTYPSMFKAWDYFMSALPNLSSDLEAVRYDAVDITRQMLQLIHVLLQYDLLEAFRKPDVTYVDNVSDAMMGLFDDMDGILLTDGHFLMGRWIADARALGTNDMESALYEYNARNQVTLWGPDGEIHDYASKQWGSLMSHYNKPRWALFISYIKKCVATGGHFNHGKFSQDVFANVEQPFTTNTTVYPMDPTGDPIASAQKIYKKWSGLLKNGVIPK